MDTNPRLETRLRAAADAAAKKRHQSRYRDAAQLLHALEKREFPREEITFFLDELERAVREKDARAVSVTRARLLEHLEQKHGLVPPEHYQHQWMALGMAVFGLPMGAMFAFALGETAFVGIGLPIGLAIGLALGAQRDRQAGQEGRVLEIEPGD